MPTLLIVKSLAHCPVGNKQSINRNFNCFYCVVVIKHETGGLEGVRMRNFGLLHHNICRQTRYACKPFLKNWSPLFRGTL